MATILHFPAAPVQRPRHRPYYTAAGLRARFAAMGFTPGRPARIDNVTWFIDQKNARRTLCPGCHRRGLIATAWCNGDLYRVLAHCPHCDAGEEI